MEKEISVCGERQRRPVKLPCGSACTDGLNVSTQIPRPESIFGAFFSRNDLNKKIFKEFFTMVNTRTEYFNATRVAVIAMFGTVAGVLYSLNIPMAAIFPFWLELNFSDIPSLIGTFALGPVSGAIIVFVKVLLKLIIKGTTTMFVGDLADLLIGIAFVVPAGLIYKKMRTFKGALIGMSAGTVCSVALAILANWLILVPFYKQSFFGGSWDPLVGGMQAIFGESCTVDTFYTFYLWCSVLPFNVLRCIIAVAITLPVYKHVSRAVNRLGDKLAPKCPVGSSEEECAKMEKKRTIVLISVCAAVVVLLVVGVLLRYYIPIWMGK